MCVNTTSPSDNTDNIRTAHTSTNVSPYDILRLEIQRLITNGMNVVNVKCRDRNILNAQPIFTSILIGTNGGLTILRDENEEILIKGFGNDEQTEEESIERFWNSFQSNIVDGNGAYSLQFVFENETNTPFDLSDNDYLKLVFNPPWNNSITFINNLPAWIPVINNSRIFMISQHMQIIGAGVLGSVI